MPNFQNNDCLSCFFTSSIKQESTWPFWTSKQNLRAGWKFRDQLKGDADQLNVPLKNMCCKGVILWLLFGKAVFIHKLQITGLILTSQIVTKTKSSTCDLIMRDWWHKTTLYSSVFTWAWWLVTHKVSLLIVAALNIRHLLLLQVFWMTERRKWWRSSVVRKLINIVIHKVKERNTCEGDEWSNDCGLITPG